MNTVVTKQRVNLVVEYRNIKTMNIRVVSDSEVVVRANPKYSPQQIQNFVDSKKNWITKQLALRRQQEALKQEGVFLFGKRYDVIQEVGSKNEVKILEASIHITHTPASDPETVLKHDLNKRIQETLHARLDACMACFPLLSKPLLEIKAMKAHWGICKYREHSIVLNAHLIHVPMACIDYVVVHELMHFYFPDHQAGFHAGMKQALPDYRERRKKIRDYEFLLRR